MMTKKIAFMEAGALRIFSEAKLNEIQFDLKNQVVIFCFVEEATKEIHKFEIYFGVDFKKSEAIAASAFLFETMQKYEYLTNTKGIVTEKGLEVIVASMMAKYNNGSFN